MSTLSLRNFAGGELDPALHSRVDNVKYATGLKTLRNCIIRKSGGVLNRPGKAFTSEIKDSANLVRLIPFMGGAPGTVGTATTARDYLLEFGPGYMRPYFQGQPVLGFNRYVTAVSNATPAVVTTAVNHGFATGDEIVFEGGPSLKLRRTRFIITVLSVTTFSLAYKDGTSAALADFDDNVGDFVGLLARRIYTLTSSPVSTLTAAMLPDLQYAQRGARLKIAHPDIDPFEVFLTSDVNPYVGSTIEVGFSCQTLSFSGANPFTNNRPAAVSFCQQRLLFGNTETDIESVYGSVVGTYDDFAAAGTTDSDAFSLSVAGREVNEVKHLLDLGGLVILTASGEWLVQGNEAGIVTPTAQNPRQFSYNGSSKLRPQIVDNTALYVQAGQAAVRDIAYQVESQGYRGNDLSIFARHLFEGRTIVDWAYQKTPNSILWCVLDNGTVIALTYIREHQIWGWHRHDTDGDYERVCAVPNGETTDIYFVVKRAINGEDKRYIERLSPREIDDVRGFNFTDSMLQYDGLRTGGLRKMLGITAVTRANPGVVTYAGDDPSNGDLYFIRDVIGMTELNGNVYRVKNVNAAANTFELADLEGNNVNTTAFSVYSSQGVLEQYWEDTAVSLSDGSAWDDEDTLTLRAQHSVFQASDVDNQIHLYTLDGNGEISDTLRLTITAFTDAKTVSVLPEKTVSTSRRTKTITGISNATKCVFTIAGHGFANGQRIYVTGCTGLTALNGRWFTVANKTTDTFKIKDMEGNYVDSSAMGAYNASSGTLEVASLNWARAVDSLKGLDHLEGKDVAILADGTVQASPNNSDYDTKTITGGALTLSRCFAKILVGLPYLCDVQTLDVDTADGETLADKKSIVNKVSLRLRETRGVFAGTTPPSDDDDDPLEGLEELKLRNQEGYEQMTNLFTGVTEETIESSWERNGRVFLRQVDPLPMGVMAIMPRGLFPSRGGGRR